MVLEDDSKSHDELKGIARKFVILMFLKVTPLIEEVLKRTKMFLFSNMYPICIND